GSAGAGAERPSAPPNALPEGLHLHTRLVTPIDFDTAWAGDAIEAVLRSPVRDKKRNIEAPTGSRLHGRLVRFAHASEPFDHFELGIELESIEINGLIVPRRAARYYRPSAMTPIIASRLPASATDGRSSGIASFRFRGGRLPLKNFESEWITISPEREDRCGS